MAPSVRARWAIFGRARRPYGNGTLLLIVHVVTAPFSAALAANYTITPRAAVQEVYTDNITLARPGNESSDFVTTVTPGVNVLVQGKRVQAAFDYGLEALFYGKESGDDSVNNQLQFDATAEMLEDMLFLELASTFSQQNTTNTGRVSGDNVSLTGNREDVLVYSVSPIWRRRYGGFGDSEVRYTFDAVDNEDSEDSHANEIGAEFRSGSDFLRFPWNVVYNYESINNQDSEDTSFQIVEGDLQYRINRQFGVLGGVGYESNDFESRRSDNDGFFWRAGGTWTPNQRLNMEVGVGDRFFGTFYFGEITYSARRFTWTASYSEEPSASRNADIERRVVEAPDLVTGEPIPTTLGEAGGDNVEEVIVRTRLDSTMTWTGRRTEAQLQVFVEKQEFEAVGDEERFGGFSAEVTRRLSPATGISLSGGWELTEFRSSDRKDALWNVGIGVDHRLGRDVTIGLDYAHLKRDSNVGIEEYEENRITALIQVIF